MAGLQNFKIDAGQTFTHLMLLSAEPKWKFGSETDQECTKDGVPKWEAQVAAGFRQFGKVVNEVIKVGIAAEKNPAEGLVPGTPVQLTGLEVGVMEKQTKDGRPVGFQVWYRAEQIRPNASTAPPKGAGAGAVKDEKAA